MKGALPRLARLKVLAFTTLALCAPVLAGAEAVERPPAPEGVPGLMGGALMAERTLRFAIGATQTGQTEGEGQTARQVYVALLSYRGAQPWQVEASLTGFDDLPAGSLQGRRDDVTDVALGVSLKYQLQSSKRWQTAMQAGLEAHYFSRGQRILHQEEVAPNDRDPFVAASLGVATSYHAAPRLWVYGEAGYSHAPKRLAGSAGFGGRAVLGAGLAYQSTERLLVYGAVKALARQIPEGIDAPDQGGGLYSFGGRFALTPQSQLNLYLTNAYSAGPIGDDLLFYPDKSQPALGVLLQYTPSKRGAEPPFPGIASYGGQGMTTSNWGALDAGRAALTLAFGTEGPSHLGLRFSPDPDLQFGLSMQDLALRGVRDFRTETAEDIRMGFGVRWQAMREDRGHPFDLGMRLSISRDVADPSIGVMFAEAEAGRDLDWGRVTVFARHASFGPDFGEKPESLQLNGVGASTELHLSDQFSALGEYSLIGEADPIWRVGLRRNWENQPLAMDVLATNAAGGEGIGTLLGRDAARLTLQWHWNFPTAPITF